VGEHVDVWETAELYTGFCLGNLRERDYLEDPGIDGRIIILWIFRKWAVRLSICLTTTEIVLWLQVFHMVLFIFKCPAPLAPPPPTSQPFQYDKEKQ
jgi:hypothetical protein